MEYYDYKPTALPGAASRSSKKKNRQREVKASIADTFRKGTEEKMKTTRCDSTRRVWEMVFHTTSILVDELNVPDSSFGDI
jgi:hypothetical protein